MAGGCRRIVAGVAVATLVAAASADAAFVYTPFNADAATPAPSPASAAGGSWTASNTSASGTNAALTFGPGVEPGSGLQFWNVTDTAGATAIGGSGVNASQNYSKTTATGATTGFTDAIATTNFTATATMRVTASAGTVSAAPTGSQVQLINDGTFFDVRNGHRIYTLGVLNDGTRQGVYYLPDGSNAAVGDGSNNTSQFSTLIRAFNVGADYFTLKMVYSPNPSDPTHAGGLTSYDGDVVNVFINNETTAAFTFNATTNAAAAAAFNNPALGRSGTYRELLGSAAQGDTQTINYRFFALETVPEPASLAALSVGAIALVRRRRRA